MGSLERISKLEVLKTIIRNNVGTNEKIRAYIEDDEALGLRQVSISIIHEKDVNTDTINIVEEELKNMANIIISNLKNERYSVSDVEDLNFSGGHTIIRCNRVPSLEMETKEPNPENKEVKPNDIGMKSASGRDVDGNTVWA